MQRDSVLFLNSLLDPSGKKSRNSISGGFSGNCINCKLLEKKISTLQEELARLTEKIERLSQFNSEFNEKQEENFLIPVYMIGNLKNRKTNNYFVEILLKCHDPGTDFKVSDIKSPEEMNRLKEDTSDFIVQVVDEYLDPTKVDGKASLQTYIYVMVSAIYKTRFGQETFPLIKKKLEELLKKYSPLKKLESHPSDIVDYSFADDFNKNVVLSTVFYQAFNLQAYTFSKDQEHDIIKGKRAPSPTEKTVARLAYGYCLDYFKIFETSMFEIMDINNKGKSFKAEMKTLESILNQLEENAAENLDPAYDYLYDLLEARVAFPELKQLELCFNEINRKYEVVRLMNRLDSELPNLTLNIIYKNMIAQIQLIYGRIDSEFESQRLKKMIKCKSIRELHHTLSEMSSYSNLSSFTSTPGRIVDDREMESLYKENEIFIAANAPEDKYRIIKSQEFGVMGTFKYVNSDVIFAQTMSEHCLSWNINSNYVSDLSIRPGIRGPQPNKVLTKQNFIVGMEGSYKNDGITSLTFYFKDEKKLSIGRSGDKDEKFALLLPARYYIVGFTIKKDPTTDAVARFSAWVSTTNILKAYPDGSTYEGEFSPDGKRNGYGVHKMTDGKCYEGEWKNDKKCGYGIILDNDGELMEGDWENDILNGPTTSYQKNGVLKYETKIKGLSSGFVNAIVDDRQNFQTNHIEGKSNGPARAFFANRYQEGINVNFVFAKGIVLDQLYPQKKIYYKNGDVYEGYLYLDFPHKFGRLTESNGSYYEGSWDLNKKTNKGIFFDAYTQEKYDGEWLNDKKNGSGTITFRNGEQLRGTWKLGNLIGKASIWRNNAMVVESMIDANGLIANGRGSIKLRNSVYYGDIKSGKFHGEGTIYFDNKDMFVGNFISGSKNGKGTYIFRDGRTFEGEYASDDLISGKGITKSYGYDIDDNIWIGKKSKPGNIHILHILKNEYYEGEFNSDDLKHGQGKYFFANKDIYEGAWLDDKFHGRGKFSMSSGDELQGTWKNGYLEGEIDFITKDGKKLRGIYSQGKIKSGSGIVYLKPNQSFDSTFLPQYGDSFYFYLDSKVKYEGEFEDFRPVKQGTFTYPDKTVVKIDWSNDMQATCLYPNGDSYEGRWLWLKGRTGEGKYISDKKSYVAIFENDKFKEGMSVRYDRFGNKFIGPKKDFQKHGKFTIYTINQEKLECYYERDQIVTGVGIKEYHGIYIYNGEFLNGKRHGKAKCFAIEDEKFSNPYEGEWLNNKPWRGKAMYRYFLKDYYVGEYFDGKRNGEGTWYFESGASYSGGWKDNLHDGFGIINLIDGKKIEGYMEKGLRKGEIKVYNKDGEIIHHNDSEKLEKVLIIS